MVIRLSALFRTETIERRYSHGWNELPVLMSGCGISEVERDIVSSDREPGARKALTAVSLVVFLAFSWMLSEKNAPGAMLLEELVSAEREAWEEIESGCYIRYDIHTAIGFRPQS